MQESPFHEVKTAGSIAVPLLYLVFTQRDTPQPIMRLLLLSLVIMLSSAAQGVSFLSFDPSSMATGGAGSAAGMHGAEPFLSPATYHRGGDCFILRAYGGARLIDRQHFISSAKNMHDAQDSLQLEDRLAAAEAAFAADNLNSGALRELGSTADEAVLMLNALPDKPLRVGASVGVFAHAQKDWLAGGLFSRRYLVLGSIINNNKQDMQSIEYLQSAVLVVADLLDDVEEIGQLVEALDQDAIAGLVQASVRAQALDPQLQDYKSIPGVTPLIQALTRFSDNVKRLHAHADLQGLLVDLVAQNADYELGNELQVDVDLPQYLRYELPDKINSTILFSGAEVEESGINLSFALPEKPELILGINIKEMLFSTIDFVQRVDQFDIKGYENAATRRDYRFWNLDVGFRYQLTEHWSAGGIYKNLRRKNMVTVLGNRIQVKPIARVGLAYQRSILQLAVDADLTKNDPLGFDPYKQYVAFGAQINYWRENALRLGYRHNFVDGTGLPSVGLGFQFFGWTADFAAMYASSNDEAGVSAQLGLQF